MKLYFLKCKGMDVLMNPESDTLVPLRIAFEDIRELAITDRQDLTRVYCATGAIFEVQMDITDIEGLVTNYRNETDTPRINSGRSPVKYS